MTKTYLLHIVRSADVCEPHSTPQWAYTNTFQVVNGKIVHQEIQENLQVVYHVGGTAQKAVMMLIDQVLDAVAKDSSDVTLFEKCGRITLWGHLHVVPEEELHDPSIDTPPVVERREAFKERYLTQTGPKLEDLSMRHLYEKALGGRSKKA